MAKSTTRTSILTDQKYMGREPEFTDRELSVSELINAYSWYNYFKVQEDSKKYIADYCNSKGIKINISRHDNNTYGWLARIVTRGGRVSAEVHSKLENYVSNLKQKKSDKAEVSNSNESIEVKNTNRLELWMPDFEEAVDNFKSPFNAYNYLVTRNVPQVYARQIAEYYTNVRNEVQAAYNKEDEDLVFAYKVHTRVELKALMTLLINIVNDCEKYLGNVKKERKPRKKKTKSTESLLKFIKYQKTDDTLKISSEDPSRILGASALYIINTRYKTVTMFVAKDESGLSVNRTSIANYDVSKSMTKRTGRQISKIIDAINNGTKRSRAKILLDLKSEPIKLAERINENCIIMKTDR